MNALAAVAAGTGAMSALFLGVLGGSKDTASSGSGTCPPSSPPVSAPASRGRRATGIPARYLMLYRRAGARYGIPWQLLAAVGKIESGHGANMGPSSAGAMGPMQFMPATWAAYGVDGDGDGRKTITNPADAIPGAARYLKASGGPGNLRKALFAYNHSTQYVDTVLAQTRRYGNGVSPALLPPVKCQPSAAGGAAPNTRGPVGRAMRWIGTPYAYGGGTPRGPSRGSCIGGNGFRGGVCLASRTIGFDCSALVQHAWYPWVKLPRTADVQYRSGHRVRSGAERPGDLVFFSMGSTGPRHVGMVVDPSRKRMVEAQQTGTRIMISRYDTRRPVGFRRPARR